MPSPKQFNGVMIGHGTALTRARNAAAYVYGEMILAGDYTQLRNHLFIGTGPNAEGVIRQTGGRASIVDDTSLERETTRGEMAVGVFGGTGRYVLEGGVATTSTSAARSRTTSTARTRTARCWTSTTTRRVRSKSPAARSPPRRTSSWGATARA
ncbi:MAG: hypothetical protein ACI4RA_00430 [Kiritimatiellia bacterium]